MTADERRGTIIVAAMHLFAQRGYFGTPTIEIARAAGLSDGYMFRLIETKEALFVAVVGRSFDSILSTFRAAAGDSNGLSSEELLDRIGKSYADVLADRDLLLIQLHAAGRVYRAGDPRCGPQRVRADGRVCPPGDGRG